MAGYITYSYPGGNYSSDEAVEGTNPEMTHGELEYTYETISIYAPAVYRNTSTMEDLEKELNEEYSTTFTVTDNDDAEDVILVQYYRDEGDDEIDQHDVVKLVKGRFDGAARLYEN